MKPLVSGIVLALIATGLMALGVSRDVKTGRAEGTVWMKDRQQPLPGATLILSPVLPNADLPRQSILIEANGEGEFQVPALPEGEYEVTAQGTHYVQSEPVKLQIKEETKPSLRIELDPPEPTIDLYASTRVFQPNQDVNFQFSGFLKGNKVKVSVLPVSPDRVQEASSLYSAAYSVKREFIAQGDKNAILKKELTLTTQDREGGFTEVTSLGTLKTGLYAVILSTPELKDNSPGVLISVTRLGLVAKVNAKKLEVWSVDLEKGEPVGGVTLEANTKGSRIISGKTDAQGRATLPLPSGDAVLLQGQINDSVALATINVYQDGENGTAYTYFDRTLYRPGDEVSFKSIFRRYQPGTQNYANPPSGSAVAELYSSDGEKLASTNGTLDAFGTFSGSFLLPQSKAGGSYVQVKADGQTSVGYIPVSAYRKPEVKITLTPEKPNFATTEDVRMKVKAEYFFGGPVPNAKVTASLTQARIWSWEWDDESEEYEEISGYLGEVEAVTNDQGEAILTYPGSKLDLSPEMGNNFGVVFDVAVSEGDDRYYDARGSAKVVRGSVDVRTSMDSDWVANDQPVKVNLEVQKLIEDVPLNELTASVRLARHDYREGNWDEPDIRILGNQSSALTADGKAQVEFPPVPTGMYYAEIEIKRGDRVEAVASQPVFVVGPGEVPATMAETPLQILLDKKKASPGDEIEAYVVAGKDAASVWVSVESGEMHSSQIVQVPAGGKKVTLKVPDVDAANVFVSAVRVLNKETRTYSEPIKLDLNPKEVKVTVTPDRDQAKPGESVRYEIKTQDASGKPVDASVSLAVVDESIFALSEDQDDPLKEFYPRLYSALQVYDSFPQVFLDGGDKGPKNVELREDFRDTASWSPSVTTGPDGLATIDVKLPDNLTAWRATAVAITKDTRLGKSKGMIEVSKELMLRLATPMFLVEGDRIEIAVNVNNGLDESQSAQVTMEAVGAEIEGAKEVAASLPAKGRTTLKWRLKAGGPGAATFTVTAKSAKATDGLRQSVPIHPWGREDRSGGAMALPAGTTSTISLPQGLDHELNLTASATLAGAFLDAMDMLVRYPYGCVEQTMSAFVPAVTVRQFLKENDFSNPDLEARIEEATRRGFNRLTDLEGPNGGFGWFYSDRADPYYTGIVLEGLWRAQQAGVSVPDGLRDRTLKAARASLQARLAPDFKVETWQESGYSQLALGLSLWGDENARQFLARAFDQKADTYDLSVRLLGLAGAGYTASYENLRTELIRRSDRRAESLIWDADGWGYRSTPRILEAFIKQNPNDPTITQVAMGLFGLSRGDRWVNTYDTGLSLIALTAYVKSTQELFGEPVLEVRRDAQSLWTAAFPAGDRFKPKTEKLSGFAPGSLEAATSESGISYLNWYSTRWVQDGIEKPASANGSVRVERTFHRLQPERQSDGRTILVPGPAETRFKSGEVLVCRVRVTPSAQMNNVIVKVPYPSTLRPNVNLDRFSWPTWWANVDEQDDHVAYFLGSLGTEPTIFDVYMRAEQVGQARARPAIAEEMYAPQNYGDSGGITVEIVP